MTEYKRECNEVQQKCIKKQMRKDEKMSRELSKHIRENHIKSENRRKADRNWRYCVEVSSYEMSLLRTRQFSFELK
jgi:hypothetical protein